MKKVLAGEAVTRVEAIPVVPLPVAEHPIFEKRPRGERISNDRVGIDKTKTTTIWPSKNTLTIDKLRHSDYVKSVDVFSLEKSRVSEIDFHTQNSFPIRWLCVTAILSYGKVLRMHDAR